MNPKEALDVLKQACSKCMGTLQDHAIMQQALKVIEDALKPEQIEKKE